MMKSDDRPLIDKSISRLDLARAGRWPCCGGWYPGVHRGGCRVSVQDIRTPQEFLDSLTAVKAPTNDEILFSPVTD